MEQTQTIDYIYADAPEEFKALGFTMCVKDRATGNIAALFADDAKGSASDKAHAWYRNERMTPEDHVTKAEGILRQDYDQDVRNMADSIGSELMDRLKDGEHGESLREWLIEHIEESIDSSGTVTYTANAQNCLRFSNNDGAYIEEFGIDGVADDGVIDWSKLAYGAFMADVKERLEQNDVDLNSPVPACDECGKDDQDERRWKRGSEEEGWELICDTCHDEEEEAAEAAEAAREAAEAAEEGEEEGSEENEDKNQTDG